MPVPAAPLIPINRVARWLRTDRARILRLAKAARIKVYRIDGVQRISGEFLGLLWCMLCLRRGRPTRRKRRADAAEKKACAECTPRLSWPLPRPDLRQNITDES
jgi:hypothetical protein